MDVALVPGGVREVAHAPVQLGEVGGDARVERVAHVLAIVRRPEEQLHEEVSGHVLVAAPVVQVLLVEPGPQ